MKKIFATIFVLTIFVSACSSSSPTAAPENAPTMTQVPAAVTATEIPSTPALTPTPILSLPVSQFTPVPFSNTKITAENLEDLQEIARYYGEVNYFAKLTKDKKHLFILDPDGLTKYDYPSMEKLANVMVANSVSNLQVSNDGNWLIIDNNWLLDLRSEKEPKLHVLSEKIDLLNFYSRVFSLSSDGSMIAAEQVRCYDLCEHKLQIVNTEDFKVLHVSSGVSHQDLPTFSPDGKYLALVDLFIEAHPNGSTNPAGASVGIWTTGDLTKVSSFGDIKFPFYVTDIAFSEDNTLLAIAQRNSIDVIDVLTGNPKATITDLCEATQRKVMFAPTSPLRVLENSDCGSGVWLISGNRAVLSVLYGYAPDFSKIVFDEKGNSNAIPYAQPTNPNVRAYYQEDYFVFLNDDILSFKHPDSETLDRHSCDLSLASSSFDCQSHARQYNNKRYLGKDVLLATDGKYYSYVVGKSRVDIYSFENPSQVYYSIPFRDFQFTLYALDPINDIIIYEFAIGGDSSRVIIQDMKNDRILEKWEGVTYITSIVFSENNKFAGICRKIGNNNKPNVDRLMIFDLSAKRTAYNMDFTCGAAALSITGDGSKLAVEHNYLRNPNDEFYSARTMILNTTPPYEKNFWDVGSWFYPYAAVFSPDDSMLVVGCTNNEICFLDPSDGREIYRMKAHSGISNLAFSKAGSVLATSSNWGLISLWAVPPFTSDVRQSQSSPISAYIPGFSWNFDEKDNFEGWGEQDWQSVDLKNLEVKNGYLAASTTGNDPQISSNEGLGIDATKFTRIEIRMHVSAGDSAELFFRHDKDDMSGEKLKTFSIQAGDEFRTYMIDMSDVTGWTGIISQLRLDPTVDAVGATIEIDYIRLLP